YHMVSQLKIPRPTARSTSFPISGIRVPSHSAATLRARDTAKGAIAARHARADSRLSARAKLWERGARVSTSPHHPARRRRYAPRMGANGVAEYIGLVRDDD